MRLSVGKIIVIKIMKEEKLTFENVGLFAMIPHSFIKEAKKLKVHTRWLYVALVFYRNTKRGIAFPSYDTIRELTGLRGEMIAKGLTELEQSGWIKPRKRRFAQSNVYQVVLKKDVGKVDPK